MEAPSSTKRLARKCLMLPYALLERARPRIPAKCTPPNILLALFAFLTLLFLIKPPIRPSAPLKIYGSIFSSHTDSDWLRTPAAYRAAGFPVPNLIHQTVKDKSTKVGKTWREKNPGWVHVVWDDKDIERFVAEYHPTLLRTFWRLKTPVERTDLWRYLVLYTYGGIYADIDVTCEVPIAEWPWDNANVLVSVEAQVDEAARSYWIMTGYNQFQQWGLMSAPSHPLLLRAAQVVTENVEREKLHPYPYKEDKMKILMRTGPGAWSDAVNEYIRQYNYRDFDVAPGNVTLGDVKFLDVGSLRDGLIKHHFAHSWHED